MGGSLSNDNLVIDGMSHTIQYLYRAFDSNRPVNELYFYVGTGGLLVPTGNLVLQLDSDEFTFADAMLTLSKYYRWNEPGLTWESGDLTVKIIERITCP